MSRMVKAYSDRLRDPSGFLALALLFVIAGCTVERGVEMTLVTAPREGQTVQDHFLEIPEGQAIGVRVVGRKKDRADPRWTVEARAENPAVVRVQLTTEKDKDKDEQEGHLFVFSGMAAGSTQIRFRLNDRHDVFVDVEITAREDWEPTVPPANFGGGGSN